MQTQTRLHKRGSKYYFRAKIPDNLRRYYGGKREVKYSLGTNDHKKAVKLAREHSFALDLEFEAIRRDTLGEASQDQQKQQLLLDRTTIQAICTQWRYLSLDGDEWCRSEGLSDSDFDERHAQRQSTHDALKVMLARGQTEKIFPALETFLGLLGVTVKANDQSYRQLAYAFLKTATEVSADQLCRDAGEPIRTPEPTSLPFSPPGSSSHMGPSLIDLLNYWEAAKSDRPHKTVAGFRLAVREFHQLKGIKPAGQYERKDFINYRDHLKNVIGCKPKTVRKKLNFLCAIYTTAVVDGKIASNPCMKINVENGKKPDIPRLSYSSESMNRIYRSPLYTEAHRPLGGGGQAAAWLPVLAPLCGARLEEMAQLRTWDVKCEDGIWFIDFVNDRGEFPTRLKTDSSVRRVPIHHKLIDMGFLNYVERRQKAGRGRLFPEIKPEKKGNISGNWGKWWGRYARGKDIGIHSEQEVFHSFRHGFRDRCREAELDEEISEALTGHTTATVGRSYGNGFSLARLQAAINKIKYPDVVFPKNISS